MSRVADNNQPTNDLMTVYNAIQDYVFQNHKFCSVDEIIVATSISQEKCRKALRQLAKNDKLSVVFEGKGNPSIYAPTYMLQEILRSQPKPRWVEKYAFTGKKEGLRQIAEGRKKLEKYEMFERLLYGTSTPLEEAVAYALQYLEFKDVKHHKVEDIQDVSFMHDGKKYLLEIEGTNKQGDVQKVSQLDRWMRTEVDKDSNPDDIVGILVVNHLRSMDPSSRDKSPLTDHARNYLKLYHFKFFTTYFLFNTVKKVYGEGLKKEEARLSIVKGEHIN